MLRCNELANEEDDVLSTLYHVILAASRTHLTQDDVLSTLYHVILAASRTHLTQSLFNAIFVYVTIVKNLDRKKVFKKF